MAEPFFRTERLTVGYNGVPLIRDIEIRLDRGRILTPVSYTHLTLPTKA